MEEEVLLPPACLEGGEVYHQVHHEGALGLVGQWEKELEVPSHCPHLGYALWEEAGEEALCVWRTGSFQEPAVSRLEEEEGVLTDREVELGHGC